MKNLYHTNENNIGLTLHSILGGNLRHVEGMEENNFYTLEEIETHVSLEAIENLVYKFFKEKGFSFLEITVSKVGSIQSFFHNKDTENIYDVTICGPRQKRITLDVETIKKKYRLHRYNI